MRNLLTTDVVNIKGKKLSKIKLPEEIFAAKINERLMAQAVRVYLANRRQGTASSKTRGEVAGSRRKIWRQKGTGRARHGDRYAPIFVGGGVAHGVKPRNWNLKMSKKMKKRALFSALSSKLQDKAIVAVEGLEKIEPKTKEMVKTISFLKQQLPPTSARTAKADAKDAKVKAKQKSPKRQVESKILLVLPEKMENILRAGRNIPYLTLKQASLLHTYEVLNHDNLVFMTEALALLKKRFGKLKINPPAGEEAGEK